VHGAGDDDPNIPQYNPFVLQKKRAEISLYDNKPHGWFNREPDRTIVMKRMERFIVEQFTLSPADK